MSFAKQWMPPIARIAEHPFPCPDRYRGARRARALTLPVHHLVPRAPGSRRCPPRVHGRRDPQRSALDSDERRTPGSSASPGLQSVLQAGGKVVLTDSTEPTERWADRARAGHAHAAPASPGASAGWRPRNGQRFDLSSLRLLQVGGREAEPEPARASGRRSAANCSRCLEWPRV